MGRSLIASDAFNRAGPGLGSDWANLSTGRGDVVINSSTKVTGQFGVSANDHAAARWVGAGTFSNDQYASVKVQSLTSFAGANDRVGVIVRASADVDGTRDYYLVTADADSATSTHSVRLSKWVNGTFTSLHQGNTTLAENDRLELEAEGTTIRVCVNGTPLGGSFTVTDSSLTTGKPGVAAAGNANCFGDDWEGGDVTAAAPPVLSSPTTTSITTTTATVGGSTDTASGNRQTIVTTSATPPALGSGVAGFVAGSYAYNSGSVAVSATGAFTSAATGLTATTNYWHHTDHFAGGVHSNTLTSAFTTAAAGPTINTQPTAQTVSEGAAAIYTVSATSSGGALSYQWQRQAPGGGAFSNVGTNSASYTTAATVCATDHGAQLRVQVTDSNGTTQSATVGLTVNATASTSRPGADVTVAGWTANTGSDLFAMIDETSPADGDYITSPGLTSSTAPATFALAFPLAAGNRVVGVRARTDTGAATLRVYLLNDAGTVMGTTADQAINSTFATYSLAVTLSGAATRARVEVVV